MPLNLNTQASWFQTFLAEGFHFSAAYGVLFTVLIKAHGAALPVSIGILIAAALKEFWYDANYELPKQKFSNNMLDFTFYAAGVLTAYLVAL